MFDLLGQIDRIEKQIDRWLPPEEEAKRPKRQEAAPELNLWLKQVSPKWNWDWEHLKVIQENLNNLTAGDINKLMIFVPPRHGKSELVTVRYPVYRMTRDPNTRIVVAAYSQTRANKFSRKARRIAESRLNISGERSAAEEWEMADGSGGYRAVGVGGGITGEGADLILIDDPIKSRKEANSLAFRETVWEWYTDDLYTRLEPGGSVVLIMTRWHEDDLAGRIRSSEDGPNWTVIELPALAEDNDPLGRSRGEALCPERFSRQDLLDIRTALGTRAFSALYQQRPQEQEGDLFKRSWFETVPADAVPLEAQRVRYWDKAATEGDGDYTAGVLLARHKGTYYIEHVVRGQWSSFNRDEQIWQTTQADSASYGDVQVWLEQEPGSSGKDSVQAIIRKLAGFSVRADRVTGSKEERADPFAAQCEAGNVKLVKAAWNNAYLDELCSFPNGAHDDQVDASSGAFGKLSKKQPRAVRSYQG